MREQAAGGDGLPGWALGSSVCHPRPGAGHVRDTGPLLQGQPLHSTASRVQSPGQGPRLVSAATGSPLPASPTLGPSRWYKVWMLRGSSVTGAARGQLQNSWRPPATPRACTSVTHGWASGAVATARPESTLTHCDNRTCFPRGRSEVTHVRRAGNRAWRSAARVAAVITTALTALTAPGTMVATPTLLLLPPVPPVPPVLPPRLRLLPG